MSASERLPSGINPSSQINPRPDLSLAEIDNNFKIVEIPDSLEGLGEDEQVILAIELISIRHSAGSALDKLSRQALVTAAGQYISKHHELQLTFGYQSQEVHEIEQMKNLILFELNQEEREKAIFEAFDGHHNT
jgi:hypothetical protein